MPDKTSVRKAAPASWAFVTPSYAGDYERCLLLCRSMDEFLTGDWHHYIIVDKPHYEMFKHLDGARRSVWLTDDVVPIKMRLIFTLPFLGGRSVWWSREIGFSIGWHVQQMVKIRMAHMVEHQGLAYLDSDCFFLRPFDTSEMQKGDKLRFYRSEHAHPVAQMGMNGSFLRISRKMLGLPPCATDHDYVDNFVTWHREEVLALCDHLGKRHGGSWLRSFRNRIQVSEYSLYGLYADEIDTAKDKTYIDTNRLCRTIWDGKTLNAHDLEVFCQELEPHQVSVGIQSFLGADLKLLEQQFELAKARYGRGSKPKRKGLHRA